MKYLSLNQNGIKDSLSMQTGDDYIGKEYHIKVLDNQQHESPKKVKRFRSAFTTDQVNYLEKQFKKFPYIGNTHRKEVASALNIPERAIKIWFQNRRMKEKKENTNKEFDDEQGIRKSLEFTKDQLNNVSVPSANEQPRSLPLLTNLSQGNCYKNMGSNISTCNVTRQMVERIDISDSAIKITAPVPQNVVTTAKVIHPPSVFVKTCQSPPGFKTSAEYSIDLCKNYKIDSYSKQPYVELAFKKEVADLKKIDEPKRTDFVEQMLPEDLSPTRKMNIPTIGQQQTLPGNATSNPGFVSLVPTVSPFYTQPYISASGVIWKPVSVMPVVTSSPSPVAASNNPLLNMSTVQDNFTKGVCNCDCHVRQVMPQVPYNFSQQSSSPQYIITAMPFQNPSTKF